MKLCQKFNDLIDESACTARQMHVPASGMQSCATCGESKDFTWGCSITLMLWVVFVVVMGWLLVAGG